MKSDDFVSITHGSVPLCYAHYGRCTQLALASLEYLLGINQEAFMVWSLRPTDRNGVPIDYKDVTCHVNHDDDKPPKKSSLKHD